MKMGKMSWIMMAGCALMLIGVFLLPALGVKLGGVVPLLIVLMCPLSHLLMMGMMSKSHDHEEHRTKVARVPTAPIALRNGGRR